MTIKSAFLLSVWDRIQKFILTLFKPLFITFIFGNLLIVWGVVEKPTFKEWCIGTMFLLVGGGAIKVGEGLQEKFINKE